jgi:hypothetical protein
VEDLRAFAHLVEAIRPWLGQLVVVGGWAQRLYRFHPLASPPAYWPIRTRDADLAFSLDAPLSGDLGAALEKAGFTPELLGEHAPPVTQYRLGAEDARFYVEFLTPLHGSGLKRSGRVDATVAAAGITAQRLRYLDVLLTSPWNVDLGPNSDTPLTKAVQVLLANPVSFIVQKLLIHGEREPRKKAQDLLYIHDTIELFGGSLDTLAALWVDTVRPALPGRTARRAERIARELAEDVTDTIREASRIPQDRRPLPEDLRAASHIGLEAILGPW